MTIWLLAIVLLASTAGLGYRQGAIRAAFSLVGILMGALLALPLGGLLGRLLGLVGFKNPVWAWVLGPVLAFVLVSALFKVAAATVHHKVDVFYKYHAGDLRLALWERLQKHLGLCVGVLNGAAYLVLISFLISAPGYLAAQVATSEKDPRWLRILNTLGADLRSSGLAKVARSVDRIPQTTYDMADFGALVYHNPLAEARLRSYPAFLSLAETPEFQTIATDAEFTKSWQQLDPIMAVLNQPSIVAVRQNPEALKVIWNTVAPNLQDLRVYLETGRSPKYDPIKILGRWNFDVNAAVAAVRRAKPTMPSSEMQKIRKAIETTLGHAAMVAKLENHQVTLRNVPGLGTAAPTGSPQTYQGQWKDLDSKYLLSFSGVDLTAAVEGDRLTIKNPGMDLVFTRED